MKRSAVIANLARNSKWWRWAAITLAYLGLTILVTYPVAFNLTTRMAGEATGDTPEFVWSTWWWAHALFDLGQNPIQISVLNHPTGSAFPLLPLMSQSFLLPVLLTRLISPVFAYNVMFVSSFVLCGLAGYALCAEVSGDRWASFVGGVIWTFFPNKVGHALGGHLFQMVIFTFPLVALLWRRMLKKPTLRIAGLTGVVTALACTVHPIYLLYFLMPVVGLLLTSSLWVERRAFWSRARLTAIALAGGVTVALIAPLLAPTLIQTSGGNLGFLAEDGASGFSLDALEFITPAPSNPFLLSLGKTPLANLARQIVPTKYESIGYLGWLPLILATLGAAVQWARSRQWVLLAAVSAVLAMGPVLHVGGQIAKVTVDGVAYPVLLPSAWLAKLPFFAWSRTPNRWEVLTVLALALLATFGLSRLRQARLWRSIPSLVLIGGVTLVITAEYLVKFPFPTVPVITSAPLALLRAAPPGEGVIQLPKPNNAANLRSLYWQTLHQHPLVGARVYRDIPGSQTQFDFLSQLLLSTGDDDIFPKPTAAQRRAMLAQAQVRWVIYDVAADPDGTARRALEKWLGAPRAEDKALALFEVAPVNAETDAFVYALGAHWTWAPAQDWGGQVGRFYVRRGLIYVYSRQAQSVRLAFTALPGPDSNPPHITVTNNGETIGQFLIGDWADLATNSFLLKPGINFLEFVDQGESYPYTGDPRCAGQSPLAGPFPVPVPCDPTDRTVQSASLALAKVRLIAEYAAPALTPSGALFGDSVRLLGYTLPAQAKPGDNLRVHLVWEAAASSPEDFTIFLHLYDANNGLASQTDGGAVLSAYPTTRWQPGEVVAHNMLLSIPPDAKPGEYTVQVGLYRWPSLERLGVSETSQTKDATVILGKIVVQP
jgi:hypothetical protein